MKLCTLFFYKVAQQCLVHSLAKTEIWLNPQQMQGYFLCVLNRLISTGWVMLLISWQSLLLPNTHPNLRFGGLAAQVNFSYPSCRGNKPITLRLVYFPRGYGGFMHASHRAIAATVLTNAFYEIFVQADTCRRHARTSGFRLMQC